MCDSFPGRLSDLELRGTLGLLLHDDGTGGNAIAVGYVAHPQSDEIAGPQFAVNREIEECEITYPTQSRW